MINLLKALFSANQVKKSKTNPIATRIEIKETSASTWWSQVSARKGYKTYIKQQFYRLYKRLLTRMLATLTIIIVFRSLLKKTQITLLDYLCSKDQLLKSKQSI